MIYNLTMPFIWSLFNPEQLWKEYKYRKVKKQLKMKSNKILQCEANQSFEKSEFEFDFRYFCILQTTALAIFFQSIIPLGLLVAAIEMLLYYFFDYYSIIKFCNKPKRFDFYLTTQILKFFDLILVFLPLGYLIIFNYFFETSPGFIIFFVLAITMFESVFNFKFVFSFCVKCFDGYNTKVLFSNIENNVFKYNECNPSTANFLYIDFIPTHNEIDMKQFKKKINSDVFIQNEENDEITNPFYIQKNDLKQSISPLNSKIENISKKNILSQNISVKQLLLKRYIYFV